MSLPGPPPASVANVQFVRGEVYLIHLAELDENKYYLVVSNNGRNRRLQTALMVRITSSAKPPLESIAVLGHDQCVSGNVLCDDIEEVWPDQIIRRVGALSISAMSAVDEALKSALSLH